MKTYGIFTAYSPNTRFEHEGLGRYLATFLKASQDRGDVRFAVACPSWSRKALKELFDSFAIDPSSYSFVGPARLPFALLASEAIATARRKRSTKGGQVRWLSDFGTGLLSHLRSTLVSVLASRNPFGALLLSAYLLPYALILILVAVASSVALVCRRAVQILVRAATRRLTPLAHEAKGGLRRLIAKVDQQYLPAGIYRSLLRREIQIILEHAARRDDVVAWYSPTALWPEVQGLKAPKLICIPDMVFSEFPVGFARYGETPRLTYRAVHLTLSHPAHFVTYSERTKWSVAVDRFGIRPASVSVVPHGANDLSAYIAISGFPDVGQTEHNYKHSLVSLALRQHSRVFQQVGDHVDFPYLFYASQFRPSKNIIVLLRAYEELQRKRRFGRKLILTGNADSAPEIKDFLSRTNLDNDVVFLPGLSTAQLAAAYSLADLAVNPSLSEGGMPFTFTEALSVGTPAVMSDIEVTREVLTEPHVLNATVFDPYDWRALADKIEWALVNRNELYSIQRSFYERRLAKRTWNDVVGEHIVLLDRLASELMPGR